ncbi:MAG: hypothetical protein AAGA22_00015 [Pseudomonadota bacterium]
MPADAGDWGRGFDDELFQYVQNSFEGRNTLKDLYSRPEVPLISQRLAASGHRALVHHTGRPSIPPFERIAECVNESAPLPIVTFPGTMLAQRELTVNLLFRTAISTS